MLSLNIAWLLILFNGLSCQDCSPNVTLNASAGTYSFNVYCNGTRTAYNGYTAYANISGVSTSTLKPNVTNTSQSVSVTMNVVELSCNVIVADFTVVNSRSTSATVGVCIYTDTWPSKDPPWAALNGSYGVYSMGAPFYIRGGEPFNGVFAGSYLSLSGQCTSSVVNVVNPQPSDNGIAVNWNGVEVESGTTRVFQVIFSNYLLEGNTSCFNSTTTCSTCTSASTCYGKSGQCYWNNNQCLNATNSPGQCSSNCSACMSMSNCYTIGSTCEWLPNSQSCIHSSHCLASNSSCGACESSGDCYNKAASCYWSSNACQNSSGASTCSGDVCSTCLSASDCASNGCSWYYGNHTCGPWNCEQFTTGATCPTANSTSCYSANNYCSWNGSVCIDNGCIHNQDCIWSQSSCNSTQRPYCSWNSFLQVCVWTGGSTNCMSASTQCSICTSQRLCEAKSDLCAWTNGACAYSPDNPSCNSSSSCESCTSVYECANVGTNCEWNVGTSGCISSEHCSAANSNCSTCGSLIECYNKSGLCYWNNGQCFNSSTSASCNTLAACGTCKSQVECGNHGCIWNSTDRTCTLLNCEQHTTLSACPTTRTVTCGPSNYCSWNASVCIDNGCSHSTDCMFSQYWCNQTGCQWNSVLQLCVYAGGSTNCMSASTGCGACTNSILCNAKDPQCYWTGGTCTNTTQYPTCSNTSGNCSSCLTPYDCTHVFNDCEWLNDNTCVHNTHCLTTTGNCSACTSPSDCYSKDAYCYMTASMICLNSSLNPTCNSTSVCSACYSEDECVNVGPGCSWNSTSNTCFVWNCEQYTTNETCPSNRSLSCGTNNFCSWNASVCIDNGCYHSVNGVVQDCMWGQYQCVSTLRPECGWNSILGVCLYIGGNTNCMSSSTSCGACTSQRLCHSKGEYCYWSGNSCLNSSSSNTCTGSGGCSSCLSNYDCLARGPGCAWNRDSYSCGSSTCDNTSSSCAACSTNDTCWAKGTPCYWNTSGSCVNSTDENTCPSGQPCSNCKSLYDCQTIRGLECEWTASTHVCTSKGCNSSSSGCSTCTSNGEDACWGKNAACYWSNNQCLNSSINSSCNSSTPCSACASSSECSINQCAWNATNRSCSILNCEQYITQDACPSTGLSTCGSGTNRCSWNASVCIDNGCLHNVDCMYTQSTCTTTQRPDCIWNSVLGICVWGGGNTNCMSSSTTCSVCTSSILCYAKSPVCYWTPGGSCFNSSQAGQSCNSTTSCSACVSSYDCLNQGNDCDWHEGTHSCVNSTHCLSSGAACAQCSEQGADTCHAKDPYCFYQNVACVNSSSNPTCNSTVSCALCLSEYDCRNRGNGCSWNAETRTCGDWNCEQYTTQASCPTSGSIVCSTSNYCSWNQSVCIDNGCIHTQDCMYGQYACGSGNVNVDCQWNAILGVCVYTGGYQTCMSRFTNCSACTSQRLCHSKNDTCYWNAQAGNAGECMNSSTSTTCTNLGSTGCPSCRSKSDCDNHASDECEWHADMYACYHELHCDSPSSNCSSCNDGAFACYQKNQYCFWSGGQCFNSSSNDTCNALSDCSSCKSSYDCINKGSGCNWNATSAACIELNCEQYTDQASCPTTGSVLCAAANRCSWNQSVCIDNGCGHSQDCMYGESTCTGSARPDCTWNSVLGVCVYTGVGNHCLSRVTNCSSCPGERLCYSKSPVCYWSGGQCINSSAGASTCAVSSCSGCLSAYDCMVRGPGCAWNVVTRVCGSAACDNVNSSCASCNTESAACWGKNSVCYWDSNSCKNSSYDNTCSSASNCSDCKSLYDCQARRGADCAWNNESKTCAARSCVDASAGCGTCSSGLVGGSVDSCYNKNQMCYWNAGNCVNTSANATCNSTSSCSDCKSSYDCTNRGNGCNWDNNARNCITLNCELYNSQTTCPTTGSISCSINNRCSWNGSVCIDNGCGHSTDCMYGETSCNRVGCSWNSILGVCVYSGGNTSCMSLTTNCSVCNSERLCHVKSHSCWWDNNTNACKNSSDNPSCTTNQNNCSACQSQSDCLNVGPNCGWHGDSFTCIPETHCLNPGSGCNDCDLEVDCYSKNATCYWAQDYCHNSSVSASCTSSDLCSQCISQYDCTNNLANGCQWDPLERICTALNCEQHMSQANCPSSGSVLCGTSNYCSWNGSACVDNGCIHGQDCIYAESSCSTRVSSPDCTWNSVLGVCVYTGGSTNCLSSSTQCDVCNNNSILCYAKSPVCFISVNTGQCINSSASSPTCTNITGCASCLSSYDCMVRGPGCSWDQSTHVCSSGVCSDSSSSCAACSSQADCWGKNPACYWEANSCKNSSFDNTCPIGSACYACQSEYDCATVRSADCEWNQNRTCTAMTCSSVNSGCAACYNASSCYGKGTQCWFNVSTGMCLNSSSNPTCPSGSICSACLSEDDCTNRGDGCLWNDYNKTCEVLNCEQFTNQSSCPTTGAGYCTSYNKCSWNSSVCVDNGCSHNQDCIYPQSSCNTSTSRPDCGWNSVLGLCVYVGGSTSCMSKNTGCSACRGERFCHGKSTSCYYNSTSGECINTTSNPTCTVSQNCSACLSYSDCTTIKSDCEWHSDSYTCVHEAHCLSPISGCDACQESDDCYGKNPACYYQQGTCRNSTVTSTCNSTGSTCASCLSEGECTTHPVGCLWNYTTHLCSIWTCEQYDAESCPTTNTSYCYADNRCSWNQSVCVDNGCIHNQDCMYGQTSCTSTTRPNCTWNSLLGVCVYSGGSTNCMALTTDCSACRSETLCFAKNFTCFWDNSSNSCNNTNSSPTCSSTPNSCASCRSIYDCENLGLDCEWHSSTHTCVHNQHCLSANANCSECGELRDCYLKSNFCFYYNGGCYNSSDNATCNSSNECSGCLSASDCSKNGRGCIWEASNNTCIPLNCERFTSRSTCPTTGTSYCDLANPCSWNSSVCVDNGCSHGQDCIYGESSCSTRPAGPNCIWNKVLQICVYSGSGTCMSNTTGCSECRTERLCSSKGYECEWTDGVCLNLSNICSNKNSPCSACSGSEAECYNKDSQCYYSQGVCVNASGTCAGTCSSCLSQFECANGYNCEWNANATPYKCNDRVLPNCAEEFNPSNPSGACGTECYYQNGTCVNQCGPGLILKADNPRYCVNESKDAVVDLNRCTGQNCFQSALSQMETNRIQNTPFSALIVIGNNMTLSNNLNFTYGNVSFVGQNKDNSKLDVAGSQIVFNARNNGIFNGSNVLLSKTVSGSGEIATSLIKASGESRSSGRFLLLNADVNYIYPRSSASPSVVSIENLNFHFETLNVSRASSSSFLNRGVVSNDGSIDNCAILTSSSTVYLKDSSGSIVDTIFSNSDSGALYIEGGNVTFVGVTFVGNVIPGFDTYTNLRHNVALVNANLNLAGMVSDIPGGYFITSGVNDQSSITSRSGNIVDLLYSPKVESFTISNEGGEIRGRLTGTFAPCSFTVIMYHDNLDGGSLPLPLFVESQTTAYVVLPNDRVGNTGNFNFQFTYKVGTHIGSTVNNSIVNPPSEIVVNPPSEKAKSNNGPVVVAIVLPIVIVIIAVIVVIVVVIVLKKKEKDRRSKPSAQEMETRGSDRKQDALANSSIAKPSDDNITVQVEDEEVEEEMEEEMEAEMEEEDV